MVRDALELAPWLPQNGENTNTLRQVCREALELGSNIFGVHHAAEAAGHCYINPAHIEEDEAQVSEE